MEEKIIIQGFKNLKPQIIMKTLPAVSKINHQLISHERIAP
jgi:hypothetical protein